MIMSLQLVQDPCYEGEAGILALGSIQNELHQAAKNEDWDRIRHLDSICANIIEKVIHANRQDHSTLIRALSELKGVYANLIFKCQQEMDTLEKVS
jgi:flagellar protein FliT